ncbi:hypothetical protein Bca52824_035260 [Brassica carinata]|uniref:Uncharacterized protein n=1 Tax=Brassica carinata TaxID=52824 RepID=A0A8X7S3X6_BRACI|nr:hypothetical protein Bca52824_035260 [Brassica carinata]
MFSFPTEERSVSNAYNVSEICLNLPMIEVGKFIASLPKDDLPLAIVESKYAAIANGVSDKDDFFIHTPRKTIAQMKETKAHTPNLAVGTVTRPMDAKEAAVGRSGRMMETRQKDKEKEKDTGKDLAPGERTPKVSDANQRPSPSHG